MDEGFQRVYLRSWVQVKELDLGNVGFAFFKEISRLSFFFCLLLGPEKECVTL